MSARIPAAYQVRSLVRGAVTASTSGTVLTAPGAGSENTPGSAVNLGTAIEFDLNHLYIQIGGTSSSADYLVTLQFTHPSNTGAQILVPNMFGNFLRTSSTQFATHYSAPMHVPAGATLQAFCQSTAADAEIDIVVRGKSTGLFGGRGLQNCAALGLNTAASRGATIASPGSAHTQEKTVLTAAGPAAIIRAYQLAVGPNGNTTLNNGRMSFITPMHGADPDEQPIDEEISFRSNSGTDTFWPFTSSLYGCAIPPSSRIVLANRANTTDTDILSMTMYAFY